MYFAVEYQEVPRSFWHIFPFKVIFSVTVYLLHILTR